MNLTEAKRPSPYPCSNCGGLTRWVLPATKRNVTTLIVYGAVFLTMLAVLMLFGLDVTWIFLSIAVLGLIILAMTKSLFRTELLCEACGARCDTSR